MNFMDTKMKKNFTTGTVITVIFLIIGILLFTSCISPHKVLQISKLEASTLYVYPKGKTTLNCLVSDPEGDDLTFKWSCTDGELTGSGPVVTWKAPNQYGEFHIMVIAQDTNGNSDEATVTIGVIVNEYAKKSCCGR
jgi:hypothetical protein